MLLEKKVEERKKSLKHWTKKRNMTHHKVFGTCDPGYEEVEKVFRKNFTSGWERDGAAFAVFHRGKAVVDLQGGFSDKSARTEWSDQTRTVIFSVTKATAALMVGMLVDRGRLRYDQPLVEFWPQFGQHGKQNITVEWVLCHRAGLCLYDEIITLQVAADHEKIGKIIERQKPNWEPGTRSGYHAMSFGWLVDQIIRRVDEKSRGASQFFREEIAEKHNIDYFLGLPPQEQHTVSRLSMPSACYQLKEVLHDPRILLAMILLRMPGKYSVRKQVQGMDFFRLAGEHLNTFNSPDVHRLEQAAALGITRARDLAKTFALMLDGTLMSKKTAQLFDRPQLNEMDCALRVPSVKGHGFMYERHPTKPGKYLYGHPGLGGSTVMIDPEEELVMVYLCNGLKLSGGELVRPYDRLRRTVFRCLSRVPK